jgi:hypothetical protein
MTLSGNRRKSSEYPVLFMDISVYHWRNGLKILKAFAPSVFHCLRQWVRQCVAAEYFRVDCNGRTRLPRKYGQVQKPG